MSCIAVPTDKRRKYRHNKNKLIALHIQKISGAAHNVSHRLRLPVSHNFYHKESWKKLWKTLENVVDSSYLVLGGVAPPAYRQKHTPTAQSPRLSGFIDIFLYFMGTDSRTRSGHFRCHKSRKRSPGARKSPSGQSREGSLLSWLFLWAHKGEKESWQFTGRLHDMGKGFDCSNPKAKNESRRGCIYPQERCPSDFRQKNQHFKRNFSALEDTHRKIKMK